MIVFLNELSVASTLLSEEHAVASIRQLINVLRDLKKYQPALSINATIPVKQHKIDPEKTVEEVLRRDDFREEWAFLRRLADRSPLAEGFPGPKALDDFDYRCEGASSIAMGWAHLLKTATVSFCYDESWHQAEIRLACTELKPDGSLVEYGNCAARNFSRMHHIEYWEQWLRSYASEQVPAPLQVWRSRDDLFPHLRFLDRVQRDIEAMGHGEPSYKQAISALRQLNTDVSQWGGEGVPQFSSKVTGEGQTRKQLCMFQDTDGHTYCFDLHARYTGGVPGRIHFRMSPDERKAVIAYVGLKLEDRVD